MMKTITKQPILFTDVPVADLRNSMKQDLNQNLIERLWNKIRDFFLDSDKQKAFKSIHKYINTLSVLNYNSASSPDPKFNIDATSDLDSYLKLDLIASRPNKSRPRFVVSGIKLHPHCQSHTTLPSNITLF